jgi:hypothetical protein
MFMIHIGYSFFYVGWHEKTARIITIIFMVLFPVLSILSVQKKGPLFDRAIIISGWFILLVSVLFLLIKPVVISSGFYDLYAVQKVRVLTPGFSLAWMFFLFELFVTIPRFKFYSLKTFTILFLPTLIWITIRFIYLYQL